MSVISSLQAVLPIILTTAGIFIVVIAYTRVAGLRSFSKMSSFDFAMTVAVGSLMATVAVAQVAFWQGMVALAVLYGLQVVIAWWRRRAGFKRVVDNQPWLLVRDGQLLIDNMKTCRVTKGDIMSKLREANVHDLAVVQAVVMETTGDLSVIHGGEPLTPALLAGVQGVDRAAKKSA